MASDIAAQIVRDAATKGVTITTAESCTGGMISAALTDIAGSSAVFERGFVTYSNPSKSEMLGVLDTTLEAHGAVSEDVVAQMAQGARLRAGADIAVSVSGIAGPGASGPKPEGRVCFGLAWADQLRTVTHDFGAIGRDKVRAKSVEVALALIREALDDSPASSS